MSMNEAERFALRSQRVTSIPLESVAVGQVSASSFSMPYSSGTFNQSMSPPAKQPNPKNLNTPTTVSYSSSSSGQLRPLAQPQRLPIEQPDRKINMPTTLQLTNKPRIMVKVRHKNNALRTFKSCMVKVSQGDPEAQAALGLLFEKGEGTAQDSSKAIQYYKMAAIKGNANGQFHFGRCLEKGIGIKVNRKEAIKYYKLAAEQQHVSAQQALVNLREDKRKKSAPVVPKKRGYSPRMVFDSNQQEKSDGDTPKPNPNVGFPTKH